VRASWTGFRSVLSGHIEQFLAAKRALGLRFRVEEYALRLLDRFLANQQTSTIGDISPALLERFMASRPRFAPRSYNHLLGVLRRLFIWMVRQRFISRTPLSLPPRRQTASRLPFLFNLDQIRRLLDVASELDDNNRALDRGVTYRTIFAVLYGLGLRVGELCRLCMQDVDLDRKILVIRQTKFGKSRLVPFGPRMADRIQSYIRLRERRWGTMAPEAPLFSFSRDRFITPTAISQTFHQIIPRLCIQIPPGVSSPRLHDLRHSFAVGTLLGWYRSGIDPSQRLLYLSTFLGHAAISSTAVYLTITEDLLREANARFERFVGSVAGEILP
jgi:site-specific recombinase XerD